MPVRLPLFFFFFASLTSLSTAGPAAAQTPEGLSIGDDGILRCEPLTACEPGGTPCDGGGTCSSVGPDPDQYYCNFGQDTFLCCRASGTGSASDQCNVDGVMGECLEDLGEGAPESGVCVFGEGTVEPTFCPHAVDAPVANWIVPCLTAVDGTRATNWNEGDCDGDGASNFDDLFCDPCDATSTPVVGTMSCEQDAGVPDGGSDADVPDSGAPDTGSSGARFQGSGGCACRASGSSSPAGGAAILCLFLAALVRTSRRAGRGS